MLLQNHSRAIEDDLTFIDLFVKPTKPTNDQV